MNSNKVAAPAVNNFDDISKVRNREDKKINFYVDRDTPCAIFTGSMTVALRLLTAHKFRTLAKAKPISSGTNAPSELYRRR